MTSPRPGGRRRRATGAAAALLLAASCAPTHGPDDWVAVREVTPSFLLPLDAADPALVTDRHGHVALTWVTRATEGQDVWLSVSRDSGRTFAAPLRLNPNVGSARSDPGNRPVPAFGPRGELAVAWSERNGPAGGSDLVVRSSGDGGMSLGSVARVNDDAAWDTTGQHGFATLSFLSDGTLFATWLEDRVLRRAASGAYWRWWHRRAALAGRPAAHQLMSARSADGGQTWGPNRVLADSACACCRPEAHAGPGAWVAIAYRRAVAGEHHPALIVASPEQRSTRDTLVSSDDSRLTDCPGPGASVAWSDAQGGRYAWRSEAVAGGICIAPWRAGDGAFGTKRLVADSLGAPREPRLVSLGRETLIGVLTRAPGDSARAVLAIRALDEAGSFTPWSLLGADVASPWLAAFDGRTAYACWIEREADRGRLRVARLRLR